MVELISLYDLLCFHRWLEHVQTALTLSTEIANTILINKRSVIVHDLTGRDFTSLIVSLVQILVDPYYRTLIGLQSLIQKDWVVKGHPFCQRLGLVQESDKAPKNWVFYQDEHVLGTNESPVFILFLDCVHQLLSQFPSRFGFTEQFLLLLVDSIHMCMFETFLFNCELERKRFVTDSLESLWDFIAIQIPPSTFKTLFLNQLYNVEKSISPDVELSLINRTSSTEMLLNSPNDFITSESSVTSSPKSRKFKKKNKTLLSMNTFYQSANDPNVSVINPDSSSIYIHLWHHYFLRWTPTVDLTKGSSSDFSQRLQQMELLDELKYLEDRYEHLKTKLNELENLTSTSNVNSRSKAFTARRPRKGLYCSMDESFNELLSNFSFCKLLHRDKETTSF